MSVDNIQYCIKIIDVTIVDSFAHIEHKFRSCRVCELRKRGRIRERVRRKMKGGDSVTMRTVSEENIPAGPDGIDRGAAQLGAQRRLSRRILNYLNRDLSDAGEWGGGTRDARGKPSSAAPWPILPLRQRPELLVGWLLISGSKLLVSLSLSLCASPPGCILAPSFEIPFRHPSAV